MWKLIQGQAYIYFDNAKAVGITDRKLQKHAIFPLWVVNT